ncbi:beta-L-arabinofuranosidase domain-containing protein [Draconibacterium orientale]|uniref:glycoside hydrolase family 127 protein n=1 Tax=Draconibacterium orientale TaxID=1168034 RepID=UPI002ABD2A6D|nr:beta-L-arabinofuranosidase domain-containing protein [Draconibacterium orientale]
MKAYKLILLILLIFSNTYLNAQTSVPFTSVNISDNFWLPRLKQHSDVTLSTCIAQMQDSTKRIENFMRAAGLQEGGHEGMIFDDSDVYKAMEGMVYSLINNPNPELEELLDQWIGYIAKAQEEDGYLNTFYTLNHPDKKWTDMDKHEMYCGGHMIEAAVAHARATNKKTFLNVAEKFVDHLMETFGPDKRHWVTGHQEIELALVKLYHYTGKKEYLDFANWLIEERGHGHGEGTSWSSKHLGSKEYCQDDVPVREISDIKGHAVRAMYLFTGMADVATETNDGGYIRAMKRVWEDVVLRNMYITGGIGSSRHNEGFTEDYDLPNKTAYAETCASIGMAFWNNRMNLLTRESFYADVMERAMYNGVLSGVSLSGDLFFYVNPLESDGNHHRQRWYGVACCPSNISRFLPSVGNYMYLTDKNNIYANLFIQSTAEIELENQNVKIEQHTDYPWNGKIVFEVTPEKENQFGLNIRIPEWCKSYTVEVNGSIPDSLVMNKGYLQIERTWKQEDKVELILDMPVELVASNDLVSENLGKRAVQRGPLVYCIEQVDNPAIDFNNVRLAQQNKFTIEKGNGKLNGMSFIQTNVNGKELTFIPYFAWDNREAGKMKVWIDFKEEDTLYKY